MRVKKVKKNLKNLHIVDMQPRTDWQVILI